VEKKIYAEICGAMTEKPSRSSSVRRWIADTKMGPLVSKEQYDRVSSYLEIGKQEAKTAIGEDGQSNSARAFMSSRQFFYDVDNNARISREEILVRLASVHSIRRRTEAIRIANDTPYGLAERCGPGTSTKHSASWSRCARDYLGQSHAADVRGNSPLAGGTNSRDSAAN